MFFMRYSMFYKSIKHHKIKILTHKLYWLSSKWVYIQFKYDIKTWKNKLFFLKIDIIFILAFLILVYHMDENGKQTNFTQKHQTLIYKKCYLRVWVCFFFVVREQDHKTPQKKNVIVFPFAALFFSKDFFSKSFFLKEKSTEQNRKKRKFLFIFKINFFYQINFFISENSKT